MSIFGAQGYWRALGLQEQYTTEFCSVKLGSLLELISTLPGSVLCTNDDGNPEKYLALPQMRFREYY